MKERKLKEEYRLETRLDTRTGKPKQIPVYMGDDYHLGGETDRRRLLSDCLVWLAALMICWFGYLMINSPSSRCIYVLPFASCASIPMLYAGIGAVNALRAPRKMTRLQQETGIARLMRSHLGCAIFLTLALDASWRFWQAARQWCIRKEQGLEAATRSWRWPLLRLGRALRA